MTDERVLSAAPGGLPTMLKAALPLVPGANLIPGVAKKGGDLPDVILKQNGITVDAAKVAAYASVCGFEPTDRLPLPYLHMLMFPLHMGIMTSSDFPFPAIGTVHLSNTIHRIKPTTARDTYDISVTAVNLRQNAKGRAFDMVAEASVDGEVVWESTSTYLLIGRGDENAAPEGEPFDVIAGTGTVWKLGGNLGRRYAAVSGDYNPIHLYPLTAKALGFKRNIAHGMWTKARAIAAIDSRLADDATVSVEFKKPIFLPASVAFGSKVVDGGVDFAVTNPKSGAPHMVGRAR